MAAALPLLLVNARSLALALDCSNQPVAESSMARSRRKTPVVGIASARSEKADKVAAHRKERRKVRVALERSPQADLLPHTREVSNPWTMAKDGKHYVGKRLSPKDRRK